MAEAKTLPTSKSKKQREMMERAARDPNYAVMRGISQAVAQSFLDGDAAAGIDIDNLPEKAIAVPSQPSTTEAAEPSEPSDPAKNPIDGLLS